jgi:hypothetical protein
LIRAEVTGPGASWAAEAPFVTPGELADAIARLAAEAPRHGKRVRMTVALESPLVQLRTLADLPPVKPRDLATLVAAQTSRYFRRNGAPLVTDAAWQSNGLGPRVARAAAAEEPWLEAIAAGARTAGIELLGVAPADAPELSLLPGGLKAERRLAERTAIRRWATVAVGMWVLLVALFAARLVVGLRETKRELARLAQPAAAVLAARRELRDAGALIEMVNQAAAHRGALAARLSRISAALPDSAFVTWLTLDASGAGVLTGLARRAADVVARLESRGAVVHPRLDGPVLRENTAGKDWERFTIVFGDGGRGNGEWR